MNLKRIVTGLLSATFSLSAVLFPWSGNTASQSFKITAYADDDEETLFYDMIDEDFDGIEDYVIITGCSDTIKNIVVPENIQGVPVTMVDDSAFYENQALVSVKLPDTVTQIGDYAFFGCTSLNTLQFPQTIDYIGSYSFYGCKSILYMTMPNALTAVNEYAFSQCTGLKKITLGNKITLIDNYAFEGCTSLTSAVIPQSVEKIGDCAFNECKNLTSITINSPECEISEDSSTICNSYDEENDVYKFTGTITGYPDSTAQEYAENNGYKFKALTSARPTEPSEPTTEPDEPDEPEIEYDFNKIDSDEDGTYDYIEITGCTNYGETIEIPEKLANLPVSSIASMAFEGIISVTSVTIPNSVKSIGSYAFRDCEDLKSITIPSSVNSIGEYAFSGTLWLAEKQTENPQVVVNSILIDGTACSGDIIILDSVKSIGAYAFSECFDLENVTIPDSVTSIGENAFFACNNLMSITVSNAKSEIDDSSDTLYAELIYGVKNSTAQEYADKYGYAFEPIKSSILRGDISGNGYIDLPDAVEIAKYILGVRIFTVEEMDIADYDNNGDVDLQDAVGIAKYILTTIKK